MPAPLLPALAALAVLLLGGCASAEQAVPDAGPAAAPCPPPGRTSVSLLDVRPGGVPDIVRVRDDVVQGLVAAGHRLVDTDREPGSEAEVTGPYDGTLRVEPLCEGVLEVRYAVLR